MQLEPGHKIIIFTDMDGTLLDHHTYSWQPATPMLAKLKALNIPVICNTSKTFAEVVDLQQAIELDGPFIVENGAAIYPRVEKSNSHSDYQPMHKLGADRVSVLTLLAELRCQGFKFVGFNDWSTEEIAEHTGLEIKQAEQAGNRHFSEPIIWQDTEAQKTRFLNILNQHDLVGLQGGRYLSIQGLSDKGKALLWLKQYYQSLWNEPVTTIALGDSANDIAMLEVADISIWIKSEKAFPKLNKTKQVIYSNGLGPIGWNETLDHILLNYK